MPNALAVGVPYDLFKHLNPVKLEPFFEANRIKRRMADEDMWRMCGSYMLSALSVAIDRAFSGRKSKAEYIKSPILSDDEERKDGFTEEELQQQREMFVTRLKAMKANFDINNKQKGEVENGR